MNYQRLDPQPIAWNSQAVLAPEQRAPWPGAELWHDADGEWYWRCWPDTERFQYDDRINLGSLQLSRIP